ncbi:hypothetical protein BDW62DRAFT_186154 [Aspergillus aurantiobrunneus]
MSQVGTVQCIPFRQPTPQLLQRKLNDALQALSASTQCQHRKHHPRTDLRSMTRRYQCWVHRLRQLYSFPRLAPVICIEMGWIGILLAHWAFPPTARAARTVTKRKLSICMMEIWDLWRFVVFGIRM